MGTKLICICIPLGGLKPFSFIARAAALIACCEGAWMTPWLLLALALLAFPFPFLAAFARTDAAEGAVALLPRPPRVSLLPFGWFFCWRLTCLSTSIFDGLVDLLIPRRALAAACLWAFPFPVASAAFDVFFFVLVLVRRLAIMSSRDMSTVGENNEGGRLERVDSPGVGRVAESCHSHGGANPTETYLALKMCRH